MNDLLRWTLIPFALIGGMFSCPGVESLAPLKPESVADAAGKSGGPWSGEGIEAVPGPVGRSLRVDPAGRLRRKLALSSVESLDGETWLWGSVGIWGTAAGDEDSGEISLRWLDGSGRVLGEGASGVEAGAPVMSWSRYSGEAPAPNYGRVATRATDGHLSNEWVSTPRDAEGLYFDLVLSNKEKVKGLRYLPRTGRLDAGQVLRYEVLVPDGEAGWRRAAGGSWPRERGWKRVDFPEPLVVDRLRLRALETADLPEKPDQFAMSAAEIEPVFDPENSTIGVDFGSAPAEVVVPVPAAELAALRGKEITCEIVNTGRSPVVLGDVMLGERGVATPARDFKVRRSQYIDLNALGLVGFSQPHWSAMQVHEVRPDSPAAGLVPGEVVLRVDGERFGPPVLNATRYPLDREWLERHHEPFVARLYARALAEGRDHMEFETWDPRTGRTAKRVVRLPRTEPGDWEGFPLRGKMADELYAELIDLIVREQRDNGTWGNMPASMGEAFGMMALLGTRDPRHAEVIHRTAGHLLSTPPSGGSSRYLGLWEIAFRTIALGEYALATGDPRAIAWLDTTCNAMVQGAHVNRSNYLAFGHDRRVLPYGTSGLIAPLSHLVIGDSLARRAGVDSGMARVFDPYIRGGWASNQPVGKQSQGYGSPSGGGGSDQAWCRSGLIALNCHLRGENDDIRRGLVAFMAEHHGFMRRSHGYGNPGGHLGLMALAGAAPEPFEAVMDAWAPVFAMQWMRGGGLGHVESQITNTFAKNPAASAKVFNYSLAVVLSARRQGLHVTGADDRSWLPLAEDAIPPAPILYRDLDGIRELRRALLDYVTARYTTDGSEPTAGSPVWSPGTETGGEFLKVAYEAANGRMGPSDGITTDGELSEAWQVIEADCGFPDLIHGIDDVGKLAVERAQYAFDGDPSTWLRSNGGIRPETAGSESGWSVTLKWRGDATPAAVAGWVFPTAPSERKGVDDSAKTVRVEASDDGVSWKEVIETEIPTDRRVRVREPLASRFLRFTLTSRSGGLLILPDVEFIPDAANP